MVISHKRAEIKKPNHLKKKALMSERITLTIDNCDHINIVYNCVQEGLRYFGDFLPSLSPVSWKPHVLDKAIALSPTNHHLPPSASLQIPPPTIASPSIISNPFINSEFSWIGMLIIHGWIDSMKSFKVLIKKSCRPVMMKCGITNSITGVLWRTWTCKWSRKWNVIDYCSANRNGKVNWQEFFRIKSSVVFLEWPVKENSFFLKIILPFYSFKSIGGNCIYCREMAKIKFYGIVKFADMISSKMSAILIILTKKKSSWRVK